MNLRSALARRTTSAVLLLAALAGGAAAKEAGPNPIPLYLQGLDVAPGLEHRLVVLHPVLAQPRTDRRMAAVSLGGLAGPELLGLGKMERSSTPRVDAVSFAAGPSVVLAGDVLRTETADFAVARDVVLEPGRALSTPLVRISRETAPDPKVVEPSMLGPVLPSAIRFHVLDGAPASEIRELAGKWAEDARVLTERLSPAELSAAELVKKRVADYRKAFGDVFKRPPTGGREAVGCAVLVAGAPASFETFADGKSFAAAWPRLLEAVAVEAAVQEVRAGTIESDIPDPADPDRFVSDLKVRLLALYGADPVQRDVRESGRSLELSLDGALARALVLGDDEIVHFVFLTDPARRGVKRPTEDADLNAAARKLRPTEEEKRLLERRNGGSAAPQPPEQPPPPPTPK